MVRETSFQVLPAAHKLEQRDATPEPGKQGSSWLEGKSTKRAPRPFAFP